MRIRNFLILLKEMKLVDCNVGILKMREKLSVCFFIGRVLNFYYMLGVCLLRFFLVFRRSFVE